MKELQFFFFKERERFELQLHTRRIEYKYYSGTWIKGTLPSQQKVPFIQVVPFIHFDQISRFYVFGNICACSLIRALGVLFVIHWSAIIHSLMMSHHGRKNRVRNHNKLDTSKEVLDYISPSISK